MTDESAAESAAPQPPSAPVAPNLARPPMYRRPLVWLIAGGTLVAMAAVAVPYLQFLATHESTDDAFIDADIYPISARVAGHVARVPVASNQWVDAGDVLAELDPAEFQARLDAATAAWQAAQARLDEKRIGVELTTTAAHSAIETAAAVVQSANAAIDAATAEATAAASQRDQVAAQLESALAAVAEAQAAILSAEAEHARDAADLARYRAMAAQGATTRQELDHIESAEKISAAKLESARSRLQTLRAHVGETRAAIAAATDRHKHAQAMVAARTADLAQSRAKLKAAQTAPQQIAAREADVAAAEADVAAARAAVAQAELDLAATKIVAPVAGFVTKKLIDVGASVQRGQRLMAVVTREVWVVANFKETQLTHMRRGQPVSITVDAHPGVEFSGRVDSIQRGTGARFSLLPPENATGNFVKVVQRVPVKIVFDEPALAEKFLLAPGMSAVPVVSIAPERPASAGDAVTPR